MRPAYFVSISISSASSRPLPTANPAGSVARCGSHQATPPATAASSSSNGSSLRMRPGDFAGDASKADGGTKAGRVSDPGGTDCLSPPISAGSLRSDIDHDDPNVATLMWPH